MESSQYHPFMIQTQVKSLSTEEELQSKTIKVFLNDVCHIAKAVCDG